MDMALMCAGLALVFAIANVVLTLLRKNTKPVLFLSMSFGLLALCAAYDSIIGLERSLVPGSCVWLAFTVVVMLLNGLSLFERLK